MGALYRVYCLVLISFYTNTRHVTLADGTFAVRFDRYNNPSGNIANGHCCDGKWGVCQHSGCDYLFTICLNEGISSHDINQCSFGQEKPERIKDVNDVVFGNTVGNLTNPIIFPFQGRIPSFLTLKIDVYDKDKWTDNDFVDFLNATINLSRYSTGSGSFVANGSRSQEKTSLSGDVTVTCATNWYSTNCGRYCSPAGYYDHYTCDPESGDKVCNDGYTGYDCTERITTTTRPTTTRPTTRPTTTKRPTTTRRQTTTRRPTTTQSYGVNDNADCDRLYRRGVLQEGQGSFNLRVGDNPEFRAHCIVFEDAGWTVIQQRNSGQLSFDLSWKYYKNGFSTFDSVLNDFDELWLGLEKIYWLTNQGSYSLYIEMHKPNGRYYYAMYDEFYIENEDENYKLHVSGYSGNAGDALSHTGYSSERLHDGQPFSTPDRDNDNEVGSSCAQKYKSGWWFNDCYWANLNGVYSQTESCYNRKCVAWFSIPGYFDKSLSATQMAIRPTRYYD